ncbi:magnesium-translocating P-type ATPase [Paenibacillus cymbidii]|uniref:magnesium-translocating P-type ATPase n=1 Tax=Paenibacillus cymbidii TaxID=1639034 RepID=UPI0010807629|nr:magnesium-translocating P-type ATPase [Paenibacillus cymbidii]
MSDPLQKSFWNQSVASLMKSLDTTLQGLTQDEAAARLERFRADLIKPKQRFAMLALAFNQVRSPITLILLIAAVLSFFLRDNTDAVIILAIVLIGGILGFLQERGAASAMKKLLAIVQIKSSAIRGGVPLDVPAETLVPGDVIMLKSGDILPGDCVVLEAKLLFVNEAALTGETFPVEKVPGVVEADSPLAHRTNTLYMGTNVVSGTAQALVVRIGNKTEFGQISERLKLRPAETEFERGVRKFGYMLMEITIALVFAIFMVNLFLDRPVLDSFLFSLALAVGLTPQLLPAIISINLSYGAKMMARRNVIVKRLASIENFGGMDVLCSDKTGTLTEGTVRIDSVVDAGGAASEELERFAYLNAHFESGYANPIDEAIIAYKSFDVSGCTKLDEIPYDFTRKRLSVLVEEGEQRFMVTKGALHNVLDICSFVQEEDGTKTSMATERERIVAQFEAFSQRGLRTLGVAVKREDGLEKMTKDDERDMAFLGFLLFEDPPKPGIAETVQRFKQLGIALKMITGDNCLIAARIGAQIGLLSPRVLSGKELAAMNDEALMHQVNVFDIFAEVEPNQKERIIHAIKKSGHVVGYIGDGINDASALHAADVGISVDTAVDVAKEAADIVMLGKDLNVLVQGVREGRKTFANTMKYVFMATSANFGNMFSMAGASLVLPFLPLLPKQILLTNLLTDFPEMTIASDKTDEEMIDRPRRWDIGFIRKFMMTFGIVSSVFDFITFGVLKYGLHATQEQFRTGWFIESVVSASLIVLVIRTQKSTLRSRPGKPLLCATLAVVAATLVLPFTPLGGIFGFTSLPGGILAAVGLIVIAYMFTAEMAKKIFYRT